MWNFTVMGVMVIDSKDFEVGDEKYAMQPQRDVTTLTSDDINIYSKLTIAIIPRNFTFPKVNF